MYDASLVNVKVERFSTFTYTRNHSYFASNLFKWVIFSCVRWVYFFGVGGFPLPRNSYVRIIITDVNFTRLNIRQCQNIKVRSCSTFRFTRDLPYIASIHERNSYVCTYLKLTRQYRNQCTFRVSKSNFLWVRYCYVKVDFPMSRNFCEHVNSPDALRDIWVWLENRSLFRELEFVFENQSLFCRREFENRSLFS